MHRHTGLSTVRRLRGLLPAALVAALGLASSGCQQPISRIVGRSVEGQPIQVDVFGRGEETVFILATIHGDEPAGIPLVRRLGAELLQHPELLEGRQVVLMPVANPDGFVHDSRENVRGVDLNRNFPAGNFTSVDEHGMAPLSEPESRAIMIVLRQYEPDRIVSIHQPLTCIDYDGPAEELALAMGTWTDLPVKRLGSRPGSLGSYAGLTLEIPIITLELPRSASKLDEQALWEEYGRCLMAAVTFPELPAK